MANLVIVESPVKCQKIQGFLGAGWRVIASMGHIRALQHSIDAVGIERDFEAKYEWIKEKSKAIKQLKDAAKDAKEIYLAADKDREGEGIAYAVCLLLKLNPKTAKRITFTEITEKAIKHAVQHPQTLDMNQVHAQQARAMLDMMIGFTISPLLWKYVAPSLSAGRCQTPALRLVIERENAIQDFKASSSWQLQATFQHPSLSFDTTMTDELEDEESALNYMENIYTVTQGTITKNEIKPWSESAPQPFMTSTLQQQASALYGINPANTMKIAQKLYEAGHITYMRTDKAVLSEEAAVAAKEWVKTAYGEEYVGQAQTKVKAKQVQQLAVQAQQLAQEAHEAIRPTHMEVETIQGDANEKKLYRLIWQRTIQSVMSPARGETCHISIQIQGDTDFNWLARWKRTTFEGWKRAGSVANLDEDDSLLEATTEWEKASLMKLGDKVDWNAIRAEPKESKAKGRYTEATLVRDMETYGIGRPSTFASLLSVIQEKDYVATRDLPAKEVIATEYRIQPQTWPPAKSETKKKVGAEKNKLVPTDLGRSVWNWLKTQFDDLFAYGFTAQMEQRLDQIAHPTKDQQSWKQLLHEIWNSYRARVETLTSDQPAISNSKIRTFANGLKAVQSKKGPILLMEGVTKDDTQFFGWPKDTAFDQITEEQAIQFQKDQNILRSGSDFGEWNGNRIQKRSGKFGSYLQSGSISIPFQENEPMEETVRRLEAKQAGGAAGAIQTFKEFSIRTGPYGPYIMKPSLKKPQFVSLPKGIDPNSLKETEVAVLYKLGLEEKKRHKKYSRGPKASADSSFLPASK
jgi:DNA topoisomerase-1